MQWRKSQGLPEGFEMLKKHKPIIAVGAEGPLDGETMVADYYRTLVLSILRVCLPVTDGIDGLGGVHTSARLASHSLCTLH